MLGQMPANVYNVICKKDEGKLRMLYFDHAASTPPFPEVIDSVTKTMQQYYANPSSIHRLGQAAEQLLHKAREVVAGSLGVDAQTIVFTSGGTESNNLAIKGAVLAYRNRGNHIVTTAIEHASVYECCKQLEQAGYRVTYISADASGRVDPDEVRQALTEETVLVSIMHVNNETGSIQPIEQIGAILRDYPRILFHVDAVQSLGKIPVLPREWGIDLLSGSAHKFHGPRGSGLLYVRSNVTLAPLQAGGAQEGGRRSGTEHVALIVGMAKALRMMTEQLPANMEHLYRLRERLLHHIAMIPELEVIGSTNSDEMAPHIVQCVFPGMKPEVVVHALEEHGIYISTRSACSSGELKPSRILSGMGLPEYWAQSGLRISMAETHTEQDIDVLGDALKRVVAQLKSLLGTTEGLR